MLTHVISVLITIYLDYVGVTVLVLLQGVVSVQHKKLDLRKTLNTEGYTVIYCGKKVKYKLDSSPSGKGLYPGPRDIWKYG